MMARGWEFFVDLSEVTYQHDSIVTWAIISEQSQCSIYYEMCTCFCCYYDGDYVTYLPIIVRINSLAMITPVPVT